MNFKSMILLALASILCVLCLVACDNGTTEPQTTEAETQAPTTAQTEAPTTVQTTEEPTTEDSRVTYTVTVVDANGAPVEGVVVQFCDAGGCRLPSPTNAEGVVTLIDEESDFHITLISLPEGYTSDATEYYFDGALEITVTLNAAE